MLATFFLSPLATACSCEGQAAQIEALEARIAELAPLRQQVVALQSQMAAITNALAAHGAGSGAASAPHSTASSTAPDAAPDTAPGRALSEAGDVATSIVIGTAGSQIEMGNDASGNVLLLPAAGSDVATRGGLRLNATGGGLFEWDGDRGSVTVGNARGGTNGATIKLQGFHNPTEPCSYAGYTEQSCFKLPWIEWRNSEDHPAIGNERAMYIGWGDTSSANSYSVDLKLENGFGLKVSGGILTVANGLQMTSRIAGSTSDILDAFMQTQAQATCNARLKEAGHAVTFAIPRDCTFGQPTCHEVCTTNSEDQFGDLTCVTTMHIYKETGGGSFSTALGARGLKTQNYDNGCSTDGCGPNFCCCAPSAR